MVIIDKFINKTSIPRYMSISKGIYELVRQTYGCSLPTSRIKKEAFLENVREKVAYYKPRMEEACSVSLGDIFVKDFKYWLRDYISDSVKKNQEQNQKTEQHQGKKDRGIEQLAAFTAYIILSPATWTFMSVFGMEMKHYNSKIYVPFYFPNRFMDIDFKRREATLDQSVVHELSHKLWYTLGGDECESPHRLWRLWNEGFATYCEDSYFTDLYPEGYIVDINKASNMYRRDRKKIEELVEKYGREILLEVPRKWRELQTE